MSVGKSVYLAFFAILFFAPLSSFAQKTKAQLQREKQENLKKIAEAEKILTQTAGKKKNTIGQLNALNQRIKTQEDLIQSIRKELNLLNNEISENNLIIETLENDLKKLKKEYSSMVYAAYKANQGYNKLTYIFSSGSFNQFLMRLKYMEQYSSARQIQAEQIMKVQDALANQTIIIESRLSEKNLLLADQLEQGRSLTKLKTNQNKLVKNLQSQENKLRKDLDTRRKAIAALDKKISDIIREEIARAKAAEKSTLDANVKLSGEFADNKSKLPWPVNGFITQKFGKQNHPVVKGVVLNNTGVFIQTKENERVKAIFNGEVRTVAFVPTIGNTVLISHGDYFT
ncbi:MAG: peptidase M23, partial [Bacteroidota bacterium]